MLRGLPGASSVASVAQSEVVAGIEGMAVQGRVAGVTAIICIHDQQVVGDLVCASMQLPERKVISLISRKPGHLINLQVLKTEFRSVMEF